MPSLDRRASRLHALTRGLRAAAFSRIGGGREGRECGRARAHKVIRVDLSAIGDSALTADIDVPKGREDLGDIPVTYVPARNTVMLAVALAYAETLEADDIFVGVNAVDYSGYPDCRPEFIASFEELANLATKRGVEGRRLTIHAPLIEWTKVKIIREGLSLGVDYGLTHSCYDPSLQGRPCGGAILASSVKRPSLSLAWRTRPLPESKLRIAEIFTSIQERGSGRACPRLSLGFRAAICAASGATRPMRVGIRKGRRLEFARSRRGSRRRESITLC